MIDQADDDGPGRGHNGGPMLNYKKGWVAVSRAMRDHWLVGFGRPVKPANPEFGSLSCGEAWIDRIMECRYEAGTIMNGGHKMRLEAGQMLGAISYLATRWNWTPKTVRGYLDRLEQDGMITRFLPGIDPEKGMQVGKQSGIISVSNYSIYQVADNTVKYAPGHAKGTQGARKGQQYRDNKGTR